MTKYRDGEFIPLGNIDCNDVPNVVKGHVTIEQAQAAIDSHFGEGEYTVTSIRHIWAFWGFAHIDIGENTSCLFPRDQPGRGRFKITECEVAA